jgi:hypothetical protein
MYPQSALADLASSKRYLHWICQYGCCFIPSEEHLLWHIGFSEHLGSAARERLRIALSAFKPMREGAASEFQPLAVELPWAKPGSLAIGLIEGYAQDYLA